MFTVEMDFDETLITILDDSDGYEDVLVYIYDDMVYIKQWDDLIEEYKEVALSPEMFDAFIQAMQLPEGAYIMKDKK